MLSVYLFFRHTNALFYAFFRKMMTFGLAMANYAKIVPAQCAKDYQ